MERLPGYRASCVRCSDGQHTYALHVVECGPALPMSGASAAAPCSVLLLHGFPDDATVWAPQLAALAARYHCIAPTLVGVPPSPAPPPEAEPNAFRVGAQAKGLVSLLDALGVQRCGVVGHDWGAAIAWRLALDFPSRVERLAVVSVGHPACGAAAGGLEQRRRWHYMHLLARPQACDWLQADDWALLRETLAAAGATGERAQRAYIARLGAAPRAMTAVYRANYHPAAMAATRVPPRAPRFAVPVLGIYPSADGALTEAQMAASGALAAAPRLWRFARIEGSGHWPQRDAPGALNALLLEFLGGGDGDSGGGGSGGDGDSGGGGSGGDGGNAAPGSLLRQSRL